VKTRESVIAGVLALAVLTGLSGCGGMSRREQNTVAGVGIGGVAGSVLTHGSTIGTVGGAAVGGVIGHEIGTDSNNRHNNRD
jgi:osmotically inducible lipoprotein OsmB